MDSVVSARAPLRISLGGGGTDLPSHFREHGGFVLSAAIDRHVHMLASTAFQERFRLKHLEWEDVERADQIRHPILRAAISRHWRGGPIELASVGDVPPGTGLGSSGAYTVCALQVLALASGRRAEAGELAEDACRIEIGDMGRSVGKQDQYAAAHGGVNAFSFHGDGSVEVRRLELDAPTLDGLRERFLLFFSGQRRSASSILSQQVERTTAGDPALGRNLQRAAALAREGAAALEGGQLARVGELMNEQWELKRERLPRVSNQRVEELRRLALSAGARGAVLMGAGGGGFLLVQTDDPDATRAALAEAGVSELPFDVDHAGCVGASGH